MSANDSNIIIGGLQMRLRSEHHSQWSYPGTHQCSQPISQLPANSEALVLVEKLQAVPASWPPGQDNYLAIAIHSVKLSHALQQQNFRKFQIFWNLLDSIVHAHQEATQELSSAASEVHVSHVSKYNLTPKDPSTLKARVRILLTATIHEALLSVPLPLICPTMCIEPELFPCTEAGVLELHLGSTATISDAASS